MRRSHKALKALGDRHGEAKRRPELTRPGDGFERKASTGGTSPMVKVNPDQRLIDEALEKRCPRDLWMAG